MPSNFLIEYRERLREYYSALHRETYLFDSGKKNQLETRFYAADYSDLFSATVRNELQKELTETAAFRETERAAIQLLIANATHENLLATGWELTEEIQAYESQASPIWEGKRIEFQTARQLLNREPDARRRHDLAARCRETVKGAQDLRAERWEKLHDAAKGMGETSYLALYQKLRDVDYEALAKQAQQILAQTENKYVSVFAPLLAREAGVTLDEAVSADLGYWQQFHRFDKHFPAWQLKHVYRETYAGLGILTYQQPNITLDDQPRANKTPKVRHFPIRVPEDIKVLFTTADGVRTFTAFLQETNHAQQEAWMSRTLHPEFRYCGDAARSKGFALLFSQLPQDARWLADLLTFYESHELRHLLAVQKLMRIRRAAAKLNYEVELHAGQLGSTAGTRFSELLMDAVRVRYDESEHLREVEDGFAVADDLRAWAFEAQLREHLKTKYGSRWWTSRKAGDFLIDLWNTGGRYKLEEMAKMIDLGELSFDWLAEECLADLRET